MRKHFIIGYIYISNTNLFINKNYFSHYDSLKNYFLLFA